jgi:hypothetical protein
MKISVFGGLLFGGPQQQRQCASDGSLEVHQAP